MEKIQNIREKIKRKLSIHDKNPNFDDSESVDEETQTRLEREMADAEEGDHPQGKPGSFLNRLISHGNKKTEDQLAADGYAERPAAAAAPVAAAPADPTAAAATEAELKQ